ncbi:MAG: hypothetical protein IJZ36_05350, partial [Bacilli bacterium]|nr:hypothetical protein [Bacilli bacterium]
MKFTKYLLMIVLSIMLVGCGKKEEVKEPTYVDGNIAVTDITGEVEGEESTEPPLFTDEEWSILKEAPRTDIGTFDTSHFTKEQLELYERLSTNKYIDFTNDEAKKAAITFFSSDVKSMGYRESASIIFHTPFLESEEGKDLANIVYSADVQDRRENLKLEGTIQVFLQPSKTFEVETYISKTDGYYYSKLGEDIDVACTLAVRDSDLYELFNDLAYIFTKVDEVIVLDTTADGYMCKFNVSSDLIGESTLLNKQYVNTSFKDYGVDTVGYLYVNTETKQIQTVTFEQTIIDTEKYGTDVDIEELKLST